MVTSHMSELKLTWKLLQLRMPQTGALWTKGSGGFCLRSWHRSRVFTRIINASCHSRQVPMAQWLATAKVFILTHTTSSTPVVGDQRWRGLFHTAIQVSRLINISWHWNPSETRGHNGYGREDMAESGPSLSVSMSRSLMVNWFSHSELGRTWHTVFHIGALAVISVLNNPWPWKPLLCHGSRSLRAACTDDRGGSGG